MKVANLLCVISVFFVEALFLQKKSKNELKMMMAGWGLKR
ncbi:hypothetical protein GCWU000325_01161 [Alloprevotella tannerae ATCC 51259]|uniref:Uncharacterized protein n=1 Tax=Alloprevotella tannerae ATCC 51259 TaxID=626522 RepID=C9LG21_9BACT|nr:hypothetical protein GCWU000325_01161 [Alloprevotella tannerae ATCC 51259]